jgi:hypothetical protein
MRALNQLTLGAIIAVLLTAIATSPLQVPSYDDLIWARLAALDEPHSAATPKYKPGLMIYTRNVR